MTADRPNHRERLVGRIGVIEARLRIAALTGAVTVAGRPVAELRTELADLAVELAELDAGRRRRADTDT